MVEESGTETKKEDTLIGGDAGGTSDTSNKGRICKWLKIKD